MLSFNPLRIFPMRPVAFPDGAVRATATAWFLFVALTLAIPAAPPSAAARRIGTKLDSIVVPRVEFDATSIGEALAFLRLQMIDLDKGESNSAAKGVNFVDLRGSEEAKPITLTLEKVPAREVLKYLCLLAGCQYTIESEAIVITDAATRRNPGGGGEQASDASPQSRLVEKFLASAVIAAVDFDTAELGDVMDFIRTRLSELRARKEDIPPVNFVLVDPELASVPVSLKLQNVSARGILGYVMEAAGAEFTVEKGIVTIRKRPDPLNQPESVPEGGSPHPVREVEDKPESGRPQSR
jgi:hypothetical protein